MQELSTKQKGDISELRFSAKLTELGADVYEPIGEDTRSDLIVDINSRILKIQVKTARYVDDKRKIEFKCCSTRSNFTETEEVNYEGDIDAFGVFHPDTESFYYVPIEDAPKSSMYLRLKPPKNNQTKNVNMAEDYILSDMLV